MPVEQPPTDIIEETTHVKRPSTQINEETTLVIISPPKDQAINLIVEPVFQTPRMTKSTAESTTLFYECFVLKASLPSIDTLLNCSGHPFFRIFLMFPKVE